MLTSGQRIGNYEVIRLLGEGGASRVYEVRHIVLDSRHALKVLRPELLESVQLRQRLLDEARIQAGLRHANILRVTDVVAEPGHAGLVVELVDGPSLDGVIGDLERPPTPAETRAVLLPVLDALEFAHRHGVIHRDLKPSNILLDRGRGGGVVPKVGDFGVAKLCGPLARPAGSPRLTSTRSMLGTHGFASPEQLRSPRDVDARADVFSLGATAFAFATLRDPFEADSDFDRMRAIVDGDFEIPPWLEESDPPLADALRVALQPDRERRFGSCAEFAAALTDRAVSDRRLDLRTRSAAGTDATEPAGGDVPEANARGLASPSHPASADRSTRAEAPPAQAHLHESYARSYRILARGLRATALTGLVVVSTYVAVDLAARWSAVPAIAPQPAPIPRSSSTAPAPSATPPSVSSAASNQVRSTPAPPSTVRTPWAERAPVQVRPQAPPSPLPRQEAEKGSGAAGAPGPSTTREEASGKRVAVRGPGEPPSVRRDEPSPISATEQAAIERECSPVRATGHDRYTACIEAQRAGLARAPDVEALIRLDPAQRRLVEASCVGAIARGPSAHRACLATQLEATKASPLPAELGRLNPSERATVERSCSPAAQWGVAAYNNCVTLQVRALKPNAEATGE